MTSGVGQPTDTNSLAWFAWKIKELEAEVQELKTRLTNGGL